MQSLSLQSRADATKRISYSKDQGARTHGVRDFLLPSMGQELNGDGDLLKILERALARYQPQPQARRLEVGCGSLYCVLFVCSCRLCCCSCPCSCDSLLCAPVACDTPAGCFGSYRPNSIQRHKYQNIIAGCCRAVTIRFLATK